MKLKRFLLGIALCTSTSLLWVSCKKNDVTLHDPLPADNARTLNGVVEDDPALVAKVPMIISKDFLIHQQTLLIEQLRTGPGKGGGPKPSTADTIAPTVAILSPANGSSVPEASNISISINATDNKGISSVSFSVDGTLQSTVSGNTTNFIWNNTGLASGSHTLVVSAKDAAGNTGSASAVVTINTTVIVPPPPSTTGNQIIMPPVITQGSEGSCVAFAVGYYTRSAEQYKNTNATSYSYATNILSPEWLFDLTKSDPSSCSGSSVLNAYNFLQSTGICTWQTVPYSSSNGCTLSPTASQTSEAANYKISSYSYVTTADVTAMKAMLDMKHPLVVSFMVDSYFYNAGPGFIWKSSSGTILGRHAVSICGYDDSKHAYKVINSWGTGWGDSGYSWIDYDYLPQLCSYSYVMNF